jgi:diguanylate cyclase (GGDEF)-like protein/PAS domain S-box-containing protein
MDLDTLGPQGKRKIDLERTERGESAPSGVSDSAGPDDARPLENPGLTRRIAPFVAANVLAFAVVPFVAEGNSRGELIAAAALIPLLVAVAYLVPWRRLGAGSQTLPPLLFFVVAVLIRDGTGGHDSVFTPLLILPVAWFAFYGTRVQVMVSVACLALAIGLPVAVDPGSKYPVVELARAVLISVIAGALAVAASQLVRSNREREAHSVSILESAHQSFISMDDRGRIVEWNPRAEQDFGWPRKEAIGRQLAETIIPERYRELHLDGFRRYLETGEAKILGRRIELTALRRDGTEFPVELSISALRTANGVRFNAFLQDISDRHDAERALHEAKERFRRAFDDAAIGMAIVSPEGRWLRANRSLAEITGYTQQQLTQMGFRDITHPEDLPKDLSALRGLVDGTRARFQTEERYFHANGHVIWVSLNVSAVRDEADKPMYLLAQMQDITERKEAEAHLTHKASHDPLTALPNRTLLDERMVRALGKLRRDNHPHTVLFLDLDRFKVVNDTRGHDAGDQLLIEVAHRLSELVRPTDTVSRLGGDEFAILCERMDESGAELLAERIDEVLVEPIEVDEREIPITASIGIAVNRDPAASPNDVIADADLAMYEAKEQGRARYAFYDPEMRERAQSRLALEAGLGV